MKHCGITTLTLEADQEAESHTPVLLPQRTSAYVANADQCRRASHLLSRWFFSKILLSNLGAFLTTVHFDLFISQVDLRLEASTKPTALRYGPKYCQLLPHLFCGWAGSTPESHRLDHLVIDSLAAVACCVDCELAVDQTLFCATCFFAFAMHGGS